MKGSNTLEIYTDGPGFMFWASTVYILKNMNINLEYGPDKIIAFSMLPDEVSMFDKGQISFYASGTGNLKVKVNGVEIYSGAPKGVTTVEFDYLDTPIKSGSNIITFIDRDGVYSLHDVELKIYLLHNKSVIIRKFNITEENYSLLEKGLVKGRIDYRVETIARPGPLTIKLNGNTLGVFNPEEGWNSAEFDVNDAQLGENDIEFSGTGGYQISEIKIGLVA